MPFAKGMTGNPKGRPPSARGKYRKAIREATDRLGAGLVEVTVALLDLARGHHVLMVRDRKGGWTRAGSMAQVEAALAAGGAAFRVYQEPPNLGAIQTVWERMAGKVPQAADVEVRQLIVAVTEDHAALARILREHVPAEYLAPVAAELERLDAQRGAALALFPG
jgi:hypothetical protein